jgi:hypothetical protein
MNPSNLLKKYILSSSGIEKPTNPRHMRGLPGTNSKCQLGMVV